MRYLCDEMRHLICEPFFIEGLHKMADELGIKRCWFHNARYPHYDIPKKRIAEIQAKCEIVEPREILRIVKDGLEKSQHANRRKPKSGTS